MGDGLPISGRSGAGRLDGVEAARGVAALLVVLRHATTILAGPHAYDAPVFAGLFMFGRAGVDFFFVLSGFIIAYVHAGDIGRRPAFPAFWRKRLLRIYPPYWIATAILVIVLLFSPTRDFAERDPVHVLSSLLLLPEQHEPILGIGWSLRHEMLFYLFFSTLLLSRLLGTVLLITWAVAIGMAAAYQSIVGQPLATGPLAFLLLRFFNVQFFVGMGVAWLVMYRPARQPGAWLLSGVTVFFGTGLYESFGGSIAPEWPPLTLAYAAGSAMALLGLTQLERQRCWTIPRPLLTLGTASVLHLLASPYGAPRRGVRPSLRAPRRSCAGLAGILRLRRRRADRGHRV